MRRSYLGALTVVAGLALIPLRASADTQTTPCPAGTNCKTITIDDSGKLTGTSTSGTISFFSLNAGTYTLVDALEALPPGPAIDGSYSLTWGSCSSGSGTNGSYTVVSGGDYPKTPPATSGTLPTITTNGSGNFVCAYTLAYPAVPADITSVRNDVYVVNSSGAVASRVASASVPPGGTPALPDVMLAILAPLGILGVIIGFVVVRQRRSAPAVS